MFHIIIINKLTAKPDFSLAFYECKKSFVGKGGFIQLAQTIGESGAKLVSTFGITNGLDVLDLGLGDGTTAIPAAKNGARVLGVDIARNLVEEGNKRAKKEALTNCTFRKVMPVICMN